MKNIPLFGVGIKSYSNVVNAQRRLNCFYELREDGDTSKIIIRGTPGSQLWVTLPTFPVRGWRVVGNNLYVVSGNKLYSINYSGSYSEIGTLSTSLGNISISDNFVQIIIVDGTFGYVFTISGSIFVTISDVNFPNGCNTVAFLDGRFIVNKFNTRQFFVSDSYDGTTWTQVIFGTKESSSDILTAVQDLNGLLILFGQSTMECWQDAGTSPLPYARINGASQTWGLAALYSRAYLANTLVFLGQNAQGGIQVLMLNGYTPIRISTSDIENIIRGFTVYQDAIALTYMIDGHMMYQITFPSGGRSFLYDALTGFWSEVQTDVALIARHYANLGISFNALNYVSDKSSGNIYQLNQLAYTDNGIAIKRQVCSRHIRKEGNDFSISEIFLNMETGHGLQDDQGSDPQIMMQISRDNGNTFGVERWTTLGAAGIYQTRARWLQCGTARDWVFQWTMTDPVPFVIADGSAVVATYDGMRPNG